MTHQVVRTRKGVLAMRNVEADEVMHPGVGPLIEAEQLYVRQSRLGDRLRESGRLVLFDIGMGAGSNALAARREALSVPDSSVLELVSFERDLGALTLALTQPEAFGLEGEAGDAARTLLLSGQHDTARVRWRLRHGDILTELPKEPLKADIVFWDPFSPKANPELWTIAAFTALRRTAGARCSLFTYSASTAVRVALLLAGWAVGVGNSIGEKSFTTAAAVVASDLARPLDRAWLARLQRAQVPLPGDAPVDAVRRVADASQFCV